MTTFKRILVPTDFSGCSDRAVRVALDLADTFGATVHVMHVVEDPSAFPWVAEAFPLSLADVFEQMQQEGRRRLLNAVPERRRADVAFACPIGSPVDEILRYAEAESIDLIVMGSHGRGVIAHALIGSVAERVLRRAPCPVLTIREGWQPQAASAASPAAAGALG
jgi:nucleotide-binding universal stress UspA family protein